MKHIYLNLKRFDIPREMGGVNSLAPIQEWGSTIVAKTQEELKNYDHTKVDFTMFFPEAHLIPAVNALSKDSPVIVGSEGVYSADTAVGGNFGAFTTFRTANAVSALGCKAVLIGHCEERNNLKKIFALAGATDTTKINEILAQEIQQAQKAGLSVLYCIGETAEEQKDWQNVLKQQLAIGLAGADTTKITIAYEPVWAIGPGKIPPDAAYIEKIASYVKEVTGGMEIVYGGGLKKDNAEMLGKISSVDGGLIALTRFQGEIGFYPEEYLEIIRTYLNAAL